MPPRRIALSGKHLQPLDQEQRCDRSGYDGCEQNGCDEQVGSQVTLAFLTEAVGIAALGDALLGREAAG